MYVNIFLSVWQMTQMNEGIQKGKKRKHYAIVNYSYARMQVEMKKLIN